MLICGSEPHETPPKQDFVPRHPDGRREVSSSIDYYEYSNNYKLSTSFDEEDDDEEEEDGLVDPQDSDEKDDCEESSRTTGSCVGITDRRTILIRGLPDRVTHKDLVENMRGGALLHIYLRARERTASISFVEEADAQGFYQHVRNYGFYVAGKRVSWSVVKQYVPL